MPSPDSPRTVENSLVQTSLHFRLSLTVISFVGLSCFSSIPDRCRGWSQFSTVLMYSLHFLVADPTECFVMPNSPLLQVPFELWIIRHRWIQDPQPPLSDAQSSSPSSSLRSHDGRCLQMKRSKPYVTVNNSDNLHSPPTFIPCPRRLCLLRFLLFHHF